MADESAKERTDRQLIELLTELRVALPGAQVLLGFLLTAPLASRFGHVSSLDRALLYACTLITAAGVLLLMAPSVYHRIRWQAGGKEDVIAVGHRLFLFGVSCLALGLLCAVFVIGDLLYGGLAASFGAAAGALLIAVTWYLLPLQRRRDPDVRAAE
jgi:high-affinity Fe2+/Pb2+ permease